MDIENALSKTLSRKKMTQIVDYVGNNRGIFKQIVNIYLAGPYRITQRAAWVLSYCVERYPVLLRPHFKEILDHIAKPGVSDAVKRNTVRLLQFVTIPVRYKGRVLDICFSLLLDKKEPVAVKVFSMTVISQLTQSQPDLRRELKIIIEDQLPFASPAFQSRARKILNEKDANPSK